ncbi:hypothetical protein PM082_009250 [Marasmius tenuissimus]|nr:hypothetical protein PM082_009250 [Marasmius tenuissimus]
MANCGLIGGPQDDHGIVIVGTTIVFAMWPLYENPVPSGLPITVTGCRLTTHQFFPRRLQVLLSIPSTFYKALLVGPFDLQNKSFRRQDTIRNLGKGSDIELGQIGTGVWSVYFDIRLCGSKG